MPEPPTLKFIQEESDTITDFCENNYPDQTGECKAMIADSLQSPPSPPEQSADPSPSPEKPPQQSPPQKSPPEEEHDPVGDAIVGDTSGEMDAIVADCLGSGFLGFHRPNMKSCMRAVAKHERERE